MKDVTRQSGENLIWQGIQHVVMNQERFGERILVYEDVKTREELEFLFRKYFEEKIGISFIATEKYFCNTSARDGHLYCDANWRDKFKDYEEFIWFLYFTKQTGIMERQLKHDETAACRLKPLQYVISISSGSITNIECRNYMVVDQDVTFEEKYSTHCNSLSKEQIAQEKERISKVLNKMSCQFHYHSIGHEVIQHYLKMMDILEAGEKKKKAQLLASSGEKGESNVDYHLRWLGSNYRTVTKDCYRDDKLTILLKKEDFIDEVQELDHILVSRHGVYLIETKYLKGKITVKKNGNWVRTDGGEEEGMLSPVAQVDRHHILVSEILGGLVAEEHIHDIICIAHDKAIIDGEENSPVPVVKADGLVRFIKTEDEKASGFEYDCEAILARIDSCKVNQK